MPLTTKARTQLPRRTLATFAALTCIATLLALSSCVSVNIGAKPGEKSANVEFETPEAPFSKLKDTRADSAWQNKNNGSSISYFSTCNDPADPSLEAVASDLFAELKDQRTILQQTTKYNAREAYDTELEGKVDGVVTRVRAVIFKKNGCTYTLSHIAVPKAFNEDRARFTKFVKSFKAP